jgi:hypothetical protein
MPEIIDELVRLAHSLPRDWKRIRYAVTQEEFNSIKDYLMNRDGEFHGRIRAVLLVIDEDPKSESFWNQMWCK